MMRVMRWITPLLAVIVAGCSSATSDFTATNTAQQKIENGVATTISLASGAQVFFPANTFNDDATVMFADILQNKDGEATYYPTATLDPEDVLAGAIINTPADLVMQRDIELIFAIRDTVTVEPNSVYALYRFDYEEDDDTSTPSRWNRWGNRQATVNASGTLASVTLPTFEMIGFVGSLALFKGLTVPDPLAEVDPHNSTWIEGYTLDHNGLGVPMDIGIYAVVGEDKYPVVVSNNDRRIPNLPDPRNDSMMITQANTINSDDDGFFRFYLPENLVGQFISLEFGHESAAYSTEEYFDVLVPTTPIADSSELAGILANDSNLLLEDTRNMVIRFGMNKVVSRWVDAQN